MVDRALWLADPVTTDTILTPDATTAPRGHRRLPWWLLVLIAVALVVGLVAALGGFRDVPLESLPKIGMGEKFEGNEVDATVTGVYLTDRPPGQEFAAEDGMQFLIVDATALNHTDEPSLLTRDLVRVLLEGAIDPGDDSTFDGVVDTRSAERIPFLQSGLVTALSYRWEIPIDAATEGDAIIIGLFERELIYGDPIFDDAYSTSPVVRILTTIGPLP